MTRDPEAAGAGVATVVPTVVPVVPLPSPSSSPCDATPDSESARPKTAEDGEPEGAGDQATGEPSADLGGGELHDDSSLGGSSLDDPRPADALGSCLVP